MEHFYVKDVQAAEGKEISEALPVLEEKTADAPKNADPGIGYIYEHTIGKKCLVFVNSREECETVTTTLRQYCDLQQEQDRFLIHHGNLSASYRETAEGIMKDDSQYMTTVTTATLELVYPKELPLFDKYDEYLPEELVRKGFAYGVLDLDGMKDTILNW